MGTTGGTPATCASTSAKAVPVPVDIFIMNDRSGSMNDTVGMSMTTKWESMTAALTAFVQSPDAVGLNVGLGLFPAANAAGGGGNGNNNAACPITPYSTAIVPITELPAGAMPIITALAGAAPGGGGGGGGGTPTLPALQGAVAYAQAWEMMMNRRVAIALATDGEPNGCMSTIPGVAAVATAAAAMGIYTFVLGVGPALQNLTDIAVAGNTNLPYLVETASTDELVAAFKSIQNAASKLACTFTVPPPPTGEALDPNKVNVSFSATGDPAMAMTLGQVPGRAQCGAAGGWFYDNPTAPTAINLCDASCQLVNTAPAGALSLAFGCATKVIQ
jgi:hypothetical protein